MPCSEKPFKPFAIESSLDGLSWEWLRQLRALSCTRLLLAVPRMDARLLHARRLRLRTMATLLCCLTVFELQDALTVFEKGKTPSSQAGRSSISVYYQS